MSCICRSNDMIKEHHFKKKLKIHTKTTHFGSVQTLYLFRFFRWNSHNIQYTNQWYSVPSNVVQLWLLSITFPDYSVVKNLPANPGTWIQSLIQEDPTCRRATKPMHHNYWSPSTLEPMFCSKRSQCNEKPMHCSWRAAPAPQLEKAHVATKTLHSQK